MGLPDTEVGAPPDGARHVKSRIIPTALACPNLKKGSAGVARVDKLSEHHKLTNRSHMSCGRRGFWNAAAQALNKQLVSRGRAQSRGRRRPYRTIQSD